MKYELRIHLPKQVEYFIETVKAGDEKQYLLKRR